ncbi:SMP-30/gluconolactonase/LRE family protein [Saccharopolyspora sp. NPDC002376]
MTTDSTSPSFDGPVAHPDGSFTICHTTPAAVSVIRPGAPSPGESLGLPVAAAAGAARVPGGVVLVADPVGHGLVLVDVEDGASRLLCRDARMHQPNDLVVIGDDRVVCTDPDWASGTGRLWLVELAGPARRTLGGRMGTTNGIAYDDVTFTLYLTESTDRRLLAADLADVLGGATDAWREVCRFDEGLADGIALARDGRVLVTVHGTGTLHVVDPATGHATLVPLRGRDCTNVAVGGRDGNDVLVTFSGPPGVQWLRADLIPHKGGDR